MKRRTGLNTPFSGLAGIVCLLCLGHAPPITHAGDSGLHSLGSSKSSFRYEGSMDEPAEGLEYAADFIFRLYDLSEGGQQIGPSLQKTSILVSDGAFITTIDFGDLSTLLSTLTEVWLQVEVRRPGEIDGFGPMRPRHRITISQQRQAVFTPAELLGTRPLDGLFGSRRNDGLSRGFSNGLSGGLSSSFLTFNPHNQTHHEPFGASPLRGAQQPPSPNSKSYATSTTTSTTYSQAPTNTHPEMRTNTFVNPVLIPASARAAAHPFHSNFKSPLSSHEQQSRLIVTPDLVGHAAPQVKAPPAYFNGRVLLDEGGEAWVTLPEQVPSLYKDPTYHLTAIGRPAPMLHVSARERDGRFKISGGSPGLEISWVVMGTRHDTWGSHRTDLTTLSNSALSNSAAADDRILAPILFETSPSAQSAQTNTTISNAAISRRRGKGPMITEVVDLGD